MSLASFASATNILQTAAQNPQPPIFLVQTLKVQLLLHTQWVGLVSLELTTASGRPIIDSCCLDNKDDQYQQYNQAMDSGNHASLGHEALAGGAAFGAMKIFEDRQRKEGQPPPLIQPPF